MKNNIVIGLLLGAVAGVLDVIPMMLQRLTWDANLSAFFSLDSFGLFVGDIQLEITPSVKGNSHPVYLLIAKCIHHRME